MDCRVAIPIPKPWERTSSRPITPIGHPRQLAPETWGLGSQAELKKTLEELLSRHIIEESSPREDQVDAARGRFTSGNDYKIPTTRARGRATRWAPYAKYQGMARSWVHADDVSVDTHASLGDA
ncbi:hypothetical protein QAD02_019508 [Eretmocerus hayati]|uniref:Uncharacterized protein n=2 Tax=Eretmocerus hayati TaxID=131215 RepID=A0ACC2NH17_9HYME|nr:hypothetical protein QAD02_001457 [Eretmocerus hayati]KAJ8683716.1 hypothetical protein QAD02_019508 [Eretmocerus hayati]